MRPARSGNLRLGRPGPLARGSDFGQDGRIVSPSAIMKLFQFWDTPEPPAEVKGWMDGFRTLNPGLEYVRFDTDSAAGFIAQHHGPREVAAFRACAVPAMQADYMRLCALDVLGGVYLDADSQCRQPLDGVLDLAPRSLLTTWLGLLNNALMLFRKPHDPFVGACLRLATKNIEERRFSTTFTAAGPGVLNAIRALIEPDALPEIAACFDNPICETWGFSDLLEHARASVEVTPELVEAYRSITLVHALAISPWIGSDAPSYKETDRHWLNWTGSIYQER